MPLIALHVAPVITASAFLPPGGGVFLCDCTSGAITLTMPPARTMPRGAIIIIKKLDATGNALTAAGFVFGNYQEWFNAVGPVVGTTTWPFNTGSSGQNQRMTFRPNPPLGLPGWSTG